jgi:hypothetical protein
MSQTQQGPMVLSEQEIKARKRMLPGALNLIGAATLGCVHWMMMLINLTLNYGAYKQGLLNQGMTEAQITSRTLTNVSIQIGFLVGCLFIAWAGMNALVICRRKTVIAGACLALVPWVTWFGFVFGIIGGVWVLVMMYRERGLGSRV